MSLFCALKTPKAHKAETESLLAQSAGIQRRETQEIRKKPFLNSHYAAQK
ncbi:MAG: hypothetical protein WCI18_01930 [Pseudomonadota bacterium]